MRADAAVGKAMASSMELVCSDCVPPKTAASASSDVRATLFHGSCAVKDQPLVCVWVRSANDLGFSAPSCCMDSAQINRAARILAISL